MAQAALARSGFSPGDVVLNTLSYHLVPAGLLLDRALVEMGCTVVPGGVGNGELQVKMMADLGVTGYVGTPSFLMALLTKAEEMGLAPPELTKSLVTAEPLPPSMRQVFVEKYGISVGNAYATAELGFLALNSGGGLPMALLPEPIVQVVDPHTGQSVGAGEAGEVARAATPPSRRRCPPPPCRARPRPSPCARWTRRHRDAAANATPRQQPAARRRR